MSQVYIPVKNGLTANPTPYTLKALTLQPQILPLAFKNTSNPWQVPAMLFQLRVTALCDLCKWEEAGCAALEVQRVSFVVWFGFVCLQGLGLQGPG